MKKTLLAAFLLVLAAMPAQGAIVTKEIPYKDGDADLIGYLAYDDKIPAPAPGVVVVHEWWGHDAYVRQRAEQLAELGYVAFAIDMYGLGKFGETPEEARALSTPFRDDRNLMRSRALAGLEVLRSQPMVDPENLAAIGYCFGGTVALELARGGVDLKGVVSFHGGLTTPSPAKPGDIRAEVLALNGADDPTLTAADRQAFLDEMTSAKVAFRMIDYPGATHAFTNPAATDIGRRFDMPVAYNAEADRLSFSEMRDFLARVFSKREAGDGMNVPP
jgi:dienelactone hydrolase